MHPLRRNSISEHPKLADRLADWLLTYCPFSTLTLLTLLVVGSTLSLSRPYLVLAPAVVADLALNAVRRVRRVKSAKRDRRAATLHPGVTA
jgi:hypothetical protein